MAKREPMIHVPCENGCAESFEIPMRDYDADKEYRHDNCEPLHRYRLDIIVTKVSTDTDVDHSPFAVEIEDGTLFRVSGHHDAANIGEAAGAITDGAMANLRRLMPMIIQSEKTGE